MIMWRSNRWLTDPPPGTGTGHHRKCWSNPVFSTKGPLPDYWAITSLVPKVGISYIVPRPTDITFEQSFSPDRNYMVGVALKQFPGDQEA